MSDTKSPEPESVPCVPAPASREPTTRVDRRRFLQRVGVSSALAGITSLGMGAGCPLPAADTPPLTETPDTTDTSRAGRAFKLRVDMATYARDLPVVSHVSNGDESVYAARIGNYSKGLPHNSLGEVDPAAYDALLAALASGAAADFESIPMGCTDGVGRRLVNPQSGLAFDLVGPDAQSMLMPPAPALASAEEAGEAAELYWMALCRDVPFSDYDSHPLTNAAAADLTRMSDFRGPRAGNAITTSTLFRGFTAGDLVGPFVSQFLLRPAPYGAQYVEQRMRTMLAGHEYMTDFGSWLSIQNGCRPVQAPQFTSNYRYMVTGRDLAEWVRMDVLFQAYFNACLILLTPPANDLFTGGLGAPLNAGNPYLASRTQEGFGTFGPPGIAAAVTEIATHALKCVWYQKWFVHRRLRPEAFGGLVHLTATNTAPAPLHGDLLNSPVLAETFSRFGTYLLPQAFPEGSPLHPSYGSGHATVAGACVTILKAVFNENFVIPNPMLPDPNDPTQLVAYNGPALTVGNELNKLAANIGTGRNIAGIHWRSDFVEAARLGEAVAIGVLTETRATCHESFSGYTFTKFDGTTITI